MVLRKKPGPLPAEHAALLLSKSHGARPVHLIITMIKWIRTSRLSIKDSVSRWGEHRPLFQRGRADSARDPPPRRNFFFFTPVTGPRRSLSLKLSDTKVYDPQIRAQNRSARASCPPARGAAAAWRRCKTPEWWAWLGQPLPSHDPVSSSSLLLSA